MERAFQAVRQGSTNAVRNAEGDCGGLGSRDDADDVSAIVVCEWPFVNSKSSSYEEKNCYVFRQSKIAVNSKAEAFPKGLRDPLPAQFCFIIFLKWIYRL
jgi:hypothetical protein